MAKKLTYYKRFPTAKAAMRAARRQNGAITDGDEVGYKSGFIAYTTKKKVKGWKKKKIAY